MFFSLQVTTVLLLSFLLSQRGFAYELHDTIHTLKEENLHLQHQLENLARALRDLKHLLIEHSKVSGRSHENEFLNAWREWSQHGISTETHQMLQQALCLMELHGAAQPNYSTPGALLLLLSPLVSMIFLLLL